MTRTTDRSAGEPDQRYRRPEPAFVRAISTALGGATTVLSVSAGVSYEPTDRDVTTVEAALGTAEPLPFADDAFDAAMSTCAVHEWGDLEQGLAEMRRVTRGPIVLMTRDPDRVEDFWLAEYAPEVVAAEARRYPSLARIAGALGDDEVTTTPLPIPFTCVDGFAEAYYARPERLLAPGARTADDAWGLVDELTERRSVAALRSALESGEWDTRHGSLRIRPRYEGSLVLVTATPRS